MGAKVPFVEQMLRVIQQVCVFFRQSQIRLDADSMAALRASGDGWQTRINDALHASLALGGKIVSR